MKHQPIARLANVTISIVAVCAWLLASNHCAIACFLPAPAQVEEGSDHCASHQSPAGEEEQEGGCAEAKCCQALSAPSSAAAKSLVQYDSALFIAKDYPIAERTWLGVQHHEGIWELDTGPPEWRSFAESVLQRSLRAHAPPLFV